MSDGRGQLSASRHSILKATTVSSEEGRLSTVRNFSDSGASLEVASPIGESKTASADAG